VSEHVEVVGHELRRRPGSKLLRLVRLEVLRFVPAVGDRDSCEARDHENSGDDRGDGRPDDSHATTSWFRAGMVGWVGSSTPPYDRPTARHKGRPELRP
jgi:hypothetical protein